MELEDSEEAIIEEQTEEEANSEEILEDNADDQESDAKSEEDKTEESDEVEIVLEGDTGSQPNTRNSGIRRRINKLNGKVDAATEQAKGANDQLAIAREENKLLQLALEQQQSTPLKADVPPDPMDFDEGAGDAGYITALQQYNQNSFNAMMVKHESTQRKEPAIDVELERSQTKHYERADKLGAKDYEETEDNAIAILGNDVVKQLIKSSDNSETILYYLGKNPKKAEYYADLIKSNAIRGIMEIGALGNGLKIRPKAKNNPAPDPDEELTGTTSARTNKRGPQGATFS